MFILVGGVAAGRLIVRAENTGRKQIGQFEKGVSGNPTGRPKGSRNAATLAIEALLDGQAEALTQKAIQMAMDGDPVALRLCLDTEYARPAKIDQ